jgi:hypothetical protein
LLLECEPSGSLGYADNLKVKLKLDIPNYRIDCRGSPLWAPNKVSQQMKRIRSCSIYAQHLDDRAQTSLMN